MKLLLDIVAYVIVALLALLSIGLVINTMVNCWPILAEILLALIITWALVRVGIL